MERIFNIIYTIVVITLAIFLIALPSLITAITVKLFYLLPKVNFSNVPKWMDMAVNKIDDWLNRLTDNVFNR